MGDDAKRGGQKAHTRENPNRSEYRGEAKKGTAPKLKRRRKWRKLTQSKRGERTWYCANPPSLSNQAMEGATNSVERRRKRKTVEEDAYHRKDTVDQELGGLGTKKKSKRVGRDSQFADEIFEITFDRKQKNWQDVWA